MYCADMQNKTVKLNIRVEPEKKEYIRRLAQKEGKTVSRYILDTVLKDEDKLNKKR